jgi:hypothetical protein
MEMRLMCFSMTYSSVSDEFRPRAAVPSQL